MTYLTWNSYRIASAWNRNTYGKAYRIHRMHLLMPLAILCLLTPCTNWLIPLLIRSIPRRILIRR